MRLIAKPLVASALLLLALPASADVRFSADDGLVFRFREVDTRIHLGGRLHLDYAFFDEDVTPIDDDFEVRRGRPLLEVEVGDDWKAKLEYELAGSRDGFRAAWIQWDGVDGLALRAGNQVVPFGLEDQESSNDLVFNERSVASALGPDYGTGFVAMGSGRLIGRSRFTLASGVYTEPLGDTDLDRHGSDHVGFAGRATFAPIARKRSVVQLGASIDYRKIGGDDGWSVARRPESQLAPSLIGVDLADVADATTFGVEAAALFGPVLFQAEYLRTGVDRESSSSLPNADFDGAYAQLSWVITGERRRYSRSRATFGRVRPRSDWGALEVGVRFATLDLTDSGVLGGETDNLTAGIGWWIRENARLMFNYVNVDARQSGTLASDEPQVFALRFVYHL
jgi:phosphate-selective porin OprO/OprP